MECFDITNDHLRDLVDAHLQLIHYYQERLFQNKLKIQEIPHLCPLCALSDCIECTYYILEYGGCNVFWSPHVAYASSKMTKAHLRLRIKTHQEFVKKLVNIIYSQQ